MPATMRQRAPEEINELFSSRWREGERWGHDDVEQLPLVSFTNDGLGHLPDVDALGAPGVLVHELSDKTLQYDLFHASGLNVPEFEIVHADKLIADGTAMLKGGALLLQPAFSSGGEQATLVRTVSELAACSARFVGKIVAARFKPRCRALSGNGIVTRGGRVLSLGVTELLQDGFRFDGFVLPSFEGERVEHEIHRLTLCVGELLRRRGYWGYFTADAIRCPHGEIYLTEANVRFSGEAAFIAAHAAQNIFELLNGETWSSSDVMSGSGDRIVVTKIRPARGEIVSPIDGPTEEDFLSGTASAFRVGYLREPTRVIAGHFVGLAGTRLGRDHRRADALGFYRAARRT